MVKVRETDSFKIPEGVKIQVNGRCVTVTGPRGTLKRDLRHMQLNFRVINKGAVFAITRWFGNALDAACIRTALSAVRNMVVGVTKGFRYRLRFAYAHFPINVSVQGQTVEIRNFLGEKHTRKREMPPGVKAVRTDNAVMKDELTLEGNDLAEVSQEAAVLHQLCLVKNKDIRMFLDGIYVQTKEKVVQEEMA